MLAVTQLGNQSVSEGLYENVLLLQNLAMQVRTDACAVAPGNCNVRRDTLPDRTKDQAFWKRFAELYKLVAASIGDTTEAQRDMSALPPFDASTYALNMVGKLVQSSGEWVVQGETVKTPKIVTWLNRGPQLSTTKTSWGTIAVVSVLAAAAGVGAGAFLLR